jgi:hypothetical protein
MQKRSKSERAKVKDSRPQYDGLWGQAMMRGDYSTGT